jgi:hypothetical protein
MSVQFDNIGDLKPKVTAGGKDNTKFVPNLNVSFFDDEFYFNLNRKDKIIKNEKAATASGKTSLGGIDRDIWYIDDKGRLKWDIEFASRPEINSWTWELKHTKGIEFYYQGELTVEEIADGCVRPDEVVGSYAVYCNKANNKYKTGKLCHIYRPFCYDAKGKTIYADLNIADGQMTISINAAWLDSAAYPVRLDPTFGYTSKGGSSADPGDNNIWAPGWATTEAGTAQSLTMYARVTSAVHFCAALYSDDDLVSSTVEGYESSYDDWKELNLNTQSAVSASTDYYLALRGEGSGITVYYDYVSGTLYRFNNPGGYSTTWANPISWSSSGGYRFSIYCTYTTGGSSHVPGIMQAMNQFNGGM